MPSTLAAALVALLAAVASPALAASGAAASHDRHVGYYYPEPETVETYVARAVTLKDASRSRRLAFVTGLTRKMLDNPYPPQFAIFAKGDDAQKMIIVSLYENAYNTKYRMRGLFAMLTATARLTRFFNEFAVADYFTFFDLAKLLGFKKITFTNGDDFAHQILIE